MATNNTYQANKAAQSQAAADAATAAEEASKAAAAAAEQSGAADGSVSTAIIDPTTSFTAKEVTEIIGGAPTSASVVVETPVAGTPVAVPVRPMVQSVVTVTPAQVANDIVTAKVEKVTVTAEGIFAQYSVSISKLSTSTQMRFTRLAAYLDAMKPGKPLNDQMGASYQRILLDVVTGIINSEEDFNSAFGILVQVFKQHRTGCFADTHAGRFIHAFPGSTDERQAFQRLINLMSVLSGLTEVTLVSRQVNLQHATAFMVSPAGRERLIAWIG